MVRSPKASRQQRPLLLTVLCKLRSNTQLNDIITDVDGTLPILQRKRWKFLETDLLVSGKAGTRQLGLLIQPGPSGDPLVLQLAHAG